VRYDGGHKRNDWLADVAGREVEWVPVCPEVEAGLGTPREPVDLVRAADGSTTMIEKHSRRDVAGRLVAFAERRVDELALENLSGYVLKSGSPSCGTSVPVENSENAPGLFARRLMARLPQLPVADERELADPARRTEFLDRVFAHHRGSPSGRRSANPMSGPQRSIDIVRVRGTDRAAATDLAAAEEPLEIRLHQRPFAVVMRTPGADRELAAGFLLSERVIRGGDDLGTIEYCTDGQAGNVVNVTLTDPSRLDRVFDGRRQVATNASCGLCGRLTIESLATDVPPVASATTMGAAALAALPARLRAAQAVFEETGGLHAAGLFESDGTLLDIAEDVGRHNAVDKVVGRMLMRDALPLTSYVLCVSGRTSYEIVQKAVVAGIPVVAAVSAPSSLAVDLARAFGVTLAGFVRGDAFNIYAHADRIR
jgi:FdhD protein